MHAQSCDIGMIGLGTMGRNLLLNMAEHGAVAAGFDKNPEQVSALEREGHGFEVHASGKLEQFLDMLKTPRNIMLLVPAGKVVDEVINELLPHLKPGDTIIDGGNSHYTDTNRRGCGAGRAPN